MSRQNARAEMVKNNGKEIPEVEIQWMNWCPEESGPACAATVLKDTGNLGLAQGFKSICISMPQLDQNKDNIKGKTWRVTVPRDWGTESITPELERAGLLSFLLIPTYITLLPMGEFLLEASDRAILCILAPLEWLGGAKANQLTTRAFQSLRVNYLLAAAALWPPWSFDSSMHMVSDFSENVGGYFSPHRPPLRDST